MYTAKSLHSNLKSIKIFSLFSFSIFFLHFSSISHNIPTIFEISLQIQDFFSSLSIPNFYNFLFYEFVDSTDFFRLSEFLPLLNLENI